MKKIINESNPKITFLDIINLQKVLDKNITQTHNINIKNTFPQKVLAFIVEVCELANEIRCFKYWSLKPPSDRGVILEEYVDGVHFVLSLGLDINFNFTNFDYNKIKTPSMNLTPLFLEVIKQSNVFLQKTTKNEYEKLFYLYFQISQKLNFSEKEIYETYILKNRINHERQKSNY